MIAILSMCRAMRGSSSEIWMPGTLVEIGLKELLLLGSQVSTWLGPPFSQSKMTDCASAAGGLPAAAPAPCGPTDYTNVPPQKLTGPTLKTERRTKTPGTITHRRAAPTTTP